KHGHGSDDDDCDHDDEDEEDNKEEANQEEAKHPGWKKAGRVAARKWKRHNGVDRETRMKDLSPEQRKEIRVAKRTARRQFVAAQENA
ncbi:hypothetical protein, partial [Salmonella sp. s58408]|uniref:hypothetical protein n=1 Tax=Salmonella sp. s58408 TaxID=3159701 RepID=UPI00397F26D5